MCTAHPACHCIPSSLSRELQGTEPQGRARRLTPHWHAHTASPRDAAASLLGLCKAFSFDCLVPCVRGRILSAEKSLVRASAAVERQEIRGHPLVFPGRPPQGPGTHVSPRNSCSGFAHPLRAQGPSRPDTTVAGRDGQVPSAHPAPGPAGAPCARRREACIGPGFPPPPWTG